MNPSAPRFDAFAQQLRASIQGKHGHATTLNLAKNNHVYRCGDPGRQIYFVETGHIKLLGLSRGGKECLMDICSPGDVFGDSCLTAAERRETAIAMTPVVLQQVSAAHFLTLLEENHLLPDYVLYLTARGAQQNALITDLATTSSEYRLGAALLRLGHKLGQRDLHAYRLQQRISHQELSDMVGTTRPRISEFMHRFHRLGLVATTPESFLVVMEERMAEYMLSSG